MTDLLDVAHYALEDDQTPSTAEQQDAREQIRVSMYKNLYGTEYAWAKPAAATSDVPSSQIEFDPDTNAAVQPSKALTHHSYIPPTEMTENESDPFGGVLDAPIG